MLLIDEIDRADEEFEAFLLEVLSDFQITIPELGTIRARRRPAVILTSNRTRELHDALKRRALFHWIGHPSIEREIEIVRIRVPGIPERLAAEAAAFVRELRGLDLAKPPGVAETIDWAMALNALGRKEIDAEVVEQTLGSVLKYREDIEAVRDETLSRLVDAARAAAAASRRCAAGDAIVGHVVTFGRVLREVGPRGRPGPRRGRAARPRRRRPDPAGGRLLLAPADARLASRRARPLRPRVQRLVPPRAGAAARQRHAQAADTVTRIGESPVDRLRARDDEDDDGDGDPLELGASGHELLREKDFAEMTRDEFRRVRRLIAELARTRPAARSRAAAPPDPRGDGSTCGG